MLLVGRSRDNGSKGGDGQEGGLPADGGSPRPRPKGGRVGNASVVVQSFVGRSMHHKNSVHLSLLIGNSSMKDYKSVTHGPAHRRRRFVWHFDNGRKLLHIRNEDDLEHEYSLEEVQAILRMLYSHFRMDYFPLANNVERLGNGTEQMGLGVAILEQEDDNVPHAQGASYLGVVLDECGYLEWNQRHSGIQWRIVDTDFSAEKLAIRLVRQRVMRDR